MQHRPVVSVHLLVHAQRPAVQRTGVGQGCGAGRGAGRGGGGGGNRLIWQLIGYGARPQHHLPLPAPSLHSSPLLPLPLFQPQLTWLWGATHPNVNPRHYQPHTSSYTPILTCVYFLLNSSYAHLPCTPACPAPAPTIAKPPMGRDLPQRQPPLPFRRHLQPCQHHLQRPHPHHPRDQPLRPHLIRG